MVSETIFTLLGIGRASEPLPSYKTVSVLTLTIFYCEPESYCLDGLKFQLHIFHNGTRRSFSAPFTALSPLIPPNGIQLTRQDAKSRRARCEAFL